MIAVVDYGMGNLRSVSKALEHLNARVQVTSDPNELKRADKIVVPGVGAFPAAMRELSARGLVEPIKDAVASGKPYLGICLGLQVLFERGEEGEGAAGLGLLPGTVKRLTAAPPLKIPHMGWNQVCRTSQDGCSLLEGIPDGSFFYFVHSYAADPRDRSVVTLESDYGGRFPAMISRGRLFATQFHPEKSQALGLRVLQNFLAL